MADRSMPALLFFSETGERLHSWGRKGKGPGEVEDLMWMGQCAPDSLFVLDAELLRLTIVTAAGVTAREGQFPLIVDQNRIACTRSGKLAGITHVRGGDHVDVKTWTFSQARGAVYISEANGGFRQILSDIPIRYPRPLGQSTFLALSESLVYLGTNDSAGVEAFSLSGESRGFGRLTVNRLRPSAQQYDLGIEVHLAVALPGLAERREHKDLLTRIPPPEFLPFYGSIVVDEADIAWAVISPLGEPRTRLQAIVLDSAPGPIIELPRNVRVFEMGRDYILGRFEDEDGEVHVAAFRLRRR